MALTWIQQAAVRGIDQTACVIISYGLKHDLPVLLNVFEDLLQAPPGSATTADSIQSDTGTAS